MNSISYLLNSPLQLDLGYQMVGHMWKLVIEGGKGMWKGDVERAQPCLSANLPRDGGG